MAWSYLVVACVLGFVFAFVLFAVLREARHAELASAVLLIVESVFLYYGYAPLAESAFAPVLVPPHYIVERLYCVCSGCIYLVKTFPARGGEGGGNHVETVGVGVCCRRPEAHLEAPQAARPAFRLVFKALDGLQPSAVVVVGIYYVEAERLGVSRTFVLAYVIFFKRVNVRIAIEYCRAYAVAQHTLYYGRRAWGATRVEQYFCMASGN